MEFASQKKEHTLAKELVVDFSEFDENTPIASKEDINAVNSQRFEMQQLDGILYDDPENRVCVGYKDATEDEFWVKGHMPGMPIMPGVVMCEIAAQLSSYICTKYDFLGADIVGLGGLEEIRFRNVVRPGDRFVVMLRQEKVRFGAMIICYFQGYVNQSLVVDGKIKGIPLPTDALRNVEG
ncbi:beta-hydroxyacyl-ACP dehydratase [bacterium]|nr:beta-hydroxyacyl-ACP dehydratase [bacterium]